MKESNKASEVPFSAALRLLQAGDLAGADAMCFRVIESIPEQSPAHARALHLRGEIARRSGRMSDALLFMRQAIEMQPLQAEMHNDLGIELGQAGRAKEAIESFATAIRLKPHYAEAHGNLGIALQQQGRLHEAIKSYSRALELRPGLETVLNNLGRAWEEDGRLGPALACYRQAVEAAPGNATFHSNLLLAMHYDPAIGPEQLLAEHRLWAERHASGLVGLPHTNDPSPERRLRIGYVSADFREHPQARFLLTVLRAHDRTRVEVFGYADVAAPDAITEQFREACDRWRIVAGMRDDALAALIREDRIDILVEQTGHMSRNRLLVFARKPAPVQMTWPGYPNTTGLPTIDYCITDFVRDPPGAEAHYVERLLRLAEASECYEPADDDPDVAPGPFVRSGHITFGSLGRPLKTTAAMLKLWAQIMLATPRSRLLLMGRESSAYAQDTRALLAAAGVDAGRVEFVPRSPRRRYMELYNRIDIALDTFPYNGHTTTLDGLWMGVPAVTLAGTTHVSREGVSALGCVGLSDLAADTPGDYTAIAIALAHDGARVVQIRQRLRETMRVSPLGDATALAGRLEEAYREAWRAWCDR